MRTLDFGFGDKVVSLEGRVNARGRNERREKRTVPMRNAETLM